MRKVYLIILLFSLSAISCSLFKKDKYGCPTNGRNVGAEKLLSGKKEDRKAAKAEKKSKFQGDKPFNGN